MVVAIRVAGDGYFHFSVLPIFILDDISIITYFTSFHQLFFYKILQESPGMDDHSGSGLPRDIPFHVLEEITNDFSDERKLGSGAFGKVYMVRIYY